MNIEELLEAEWFRLLVSVVVAIFGGYFLGSRLGNKSAISPNATASTDKDGEGTNAKEKGGVDEMPGGANNTDEGSDGFSFTDFVSDSAGAHSEQKVDPVKLKLALEKAQAAKAKSTRLQRTDSAAQRPPRLVLVSAQLPGRVVKTSKGFELQWADSRSFLANLRLLRESFDVQWVGIASQELTAWDMTEREQIKNDLLDCGCHPVFLEEKVSRTMTEFCQNVLRPILHYNLECKQPEWIDEWETLFQAYSTFNVNIMRAVLPLIQDRDRDIVWIHNYEFFLLPSFLRKKIPPLKIGVFVHTPFPSSDIFRLVPGRASFMSSLMCADLIGFHTFDYARHFISCVKRLMDLDFDTMPGGVFGVEHAGRLVTVMIRHIGIEVRKWQFSQRTPAVQHLVKSLRQMTGSRTVLLGLDGVGRIDGALCKLRAYRRLLRDHNELSSKLCLVLVLKVSGAALSRAITGAGNSLQISSDPVRSKGIMAAFHRTQQTNINDLEVKSSVMSEDMERVENLVRDIRKEFRDDVLHFANVQSLSMEETVALYKSCDVGVITTIWDGLNLIPFEMTVCQDASRPAVLVLSEFMGCARSLSGAYRVNPWNIKQCSEALLQAVNMRIDTRRLLHHRRLKYVCSCTTREWAEGFVGTLQKSTKSGEGLQLVDIGWGASVRMIGFRADYKHLSMEDILAGYSRVGSNVINQNYKRVRAMRKRQNALGKELRSPDVPKLVSRLRQPRIFLFDYDGTLTSKDSRRHHTHRNLHKELGTSSTNASSPQPTRVGFADGIDRPSSSPLDDWIDDDDLSGDELLGTPVRTDSFGPSWFGASASKGSGLSRLRGSASSASLSGSDSNNGLVTSLSSSRFLQKNARSRLGVESSEDCKECANHAEGGICASCANLLEAPSDKMLNLLMMLSEDPDNIVFIVSGRSRHELGFWFRDLPDVGLAAEKGSFIRWPQKMQKTAALHLYRRKQKWSSQVLRTASHKANTEHIRSDSSNTKAIRWDVCFNDQDVDSWKEPVRRILQEYERHTGGAWIEDKETGFVWHYENADREYGRMQASELCKFLKQLEQYASSFDVVRYDNNRILEIKPKGVSKGLTVATIMDVGIKWSQGCDDEFGQGEQKITEHTAYPRPFVICVGDDRSDESMFMALENAEHMTFKQERRERRSISNSLRKQNDGGDISLPEWRPKLSKETVKAHTNVSMRSAEHTNSRSFNPNLFTVSLGMRPTNARYFVMDYEELVDLLLAIVRVSKSEGEIRSSLGLVHKHSGVNWSERLLDTFDRPSGLETSPVPKPSVSEVAPPQMFLSTASPQASEDGPH